MMKEKQDVNPFLFRFGLALAVSVAGFLFARLRTRRDKSSSLHPADHGSDIDVGGGSMGQREDAYATRKAPCSGCSTPESVEKYEDSHPPKVSVDYSMSALSSPGKRQSGGYLLPEFNDILSQIDFEATAAGIPTKKDAKTATSDDEDPQEFQSTEKDVYEEEIEHLRNLVGMLRERERNLEVQLLEFYGLKEQESALAELQNRLKLKNVEAKHLTLKLESLKSDNQKLQAQVADHTKTVAELEEARSKIKFLTRRLKSEIEQNKEQILTLQRRVAMLQDQELRTVSWNTEGTDSDIHLNSQRLKDLEGEAEELRKTNFKLREENIDLVSRMESTQILANSVLEDPEIKELRDHVQRLRIENEELAKEVERLKEGRCKDVEELVYLRWINACLRYELRNFQPPHGKTIARDLSKSLSPRSEEKAKQLILEYANTEGIGSYDFNSIDFETDFWSSTPGSFVADSGDIDDTSESSKTNSSVKMKIFHKLRKLLRGKEDVFHHQHHLSRAKSERVLDDSYSCVSTVTDATSEFQSNRHQLPSVSLSMHSSRNSMDMNGTSSSKMDDFQHIESRRRYSEAASSRSYPHRRAPLGHDNARSLSADIQLTQDWHLPGKSELRKFAEVLKDSGSCTRNSSSISGKLQRKRSVSLGSFAALTRSATE